MSSYIEVKSLPLFLSLVPTGRAREIILDHKAEVCVGMVKNQSRRNVCHRHHRAAMLALDC